MDLGQQYDLDYTNDGLHVLEEISTVHGMSTVDILALCREQPLRAGELLSSKLGIPLQQCKRYLATLDDTIDQQIQPLFAVPIRNCIPTGLPLVDRVLQGGCPMGCITEIFGASGTGKSQLLLQIAIESQKKASNFIGSNDAIGSNEVTAANECIYISTESSLETRRLAHFAGSTVDLANISYIHCMDMENQDHIIFTQLYAKLVLAKESNKPVTVVCIDSISHHLRASESYLNSIEFLRSYLSQQENELLKDESYLSLKIEFDAMTHAFFKADKAYRVRAAKEYYLLLLYWYLSFLAAHFQIAVVVTNQISDMLDSFVDDGDAPDDEIHDPLNYEFQVGTFSGWDAPAFESILPLRHHTVSGEFAPQGSAMSANFPVSGLDHNKLDFQSKKIHLSGRNYNKKSQIPALGYTWTKLVPNRILLWKKYQWKCDLQPTQIVVPAGYAATAYANKRDTGIPAQAIGRPLERELDDDEYQPPRPILRRFARVLSPLAVVTDTDANVEYVILHTGTIEIT